MTEIELLEQINLNIANLTEVGGYVLGIFNFWSCCLPLLDCL